MDPRGGTSLCSISIPELAKGSLLLGKGELVKGDSANSMLIRLTGMACYITYSNESFCHEVLK